MAENEIFIAVAHLAADLNSIVVDWVELNSLVKELKKLIGGFDVF